MLNKVINKIKKFPYVVRAHFKYREFCTQHGLLEAEKIFTHLTSQEKRRLFDAAYSVQSGYAVEIGSFVGASSCFIAAGLKQNSKLICIDTWENDAMSEGKRDTLKEFSRNTKRFSHKLIPVRGYSQNVVNEVRKTTDEISLLFIDGDHSYEGCKRDVDLYLPLVKSGGIVIFHDSGWADGVLKVINDVKPRMSRHDKSSNMFWGWMK